VVTLSTYLPTLIAGAATVYHEDLDSTDLPVVRVVLLCGPEPTDALHAQEIISTSSSEHLALAVADLSLGGTSKICNVCFFSFLHLHPDRSSSVPE
jgi:hypothetical protein